MLLHLLHLLMAGYRTIRPFAAMQHHARSWGDSGLSADDVFGPVIPKLKCGSNAGAAQFGFAKTAARRRSPAIRLARILSMRRLSKSTISKRQP